jgi:hypothetical protein
MLSKLTSVRIYRTNSVNCSPAAPDGFRFGEEAGAGDARQIQAARRIIAAATLWPAP